MVLGFPRRRSRSSCGACARPLARPGAIALFGSAAAGEYRPEASNLNLFCVVRDTSFGVLKAIGPAVKWWSEQKQPAPLLMTRVELERLTDVFTIELLDMQRHHRVLYGDDVIAKLDIPMKLHRVQVEYELREKLVLLRQTALLAVNDDALVGDTDALRVFVRDVVPAFADHFVANRTGDQASGGRAPGAAMRIRWHSVRDGAQEHPGEESGCGEKSM